MQFADLHLDPRLLSAVADCGYTKPTPVQMAAIPSVLAGKDVVALAQTGTGKTAAFALPLLHRLLQSPAPRSHGRPIRALVLAPTRELATQINEDFIAYGKRSGLTSTVIFGGVGHEPQRVALRRGVDVLVATPGRLLDLMSERIVDFRALEVFILDEADRMLDMGFIHDVKKIVGALPAVRQNLLFSATMPPEVEQLAKKVAPDPVRIAVTPPSTTVEKIAQSVFFVGQTQKRALLLHLLSDAAVKRALIFTRTKHGANRVAEFLDGKVGAQAIHGNKSQNARTRALDDFKRGTIRALVATDIAARGIDVDDVTHVIQIDLPEVPEQYVHRIGRTARAGASGISWAFCSSDERGLLRDIEKNIGMKVDVVAEHPFIASANNPEPEAERRPRQQRGGPRRDGRSGRTGRPPPRGGGGGPSHSAPPSGVTRSFRPSR